MPARLTFDNVATPDPSVDALPVGFPFSVKLIDLPATPVPPAVSVADSIVVPPKVPDAVATASDVLAPVAGTSEKFCVVVTPAKMVTEIVEPLNPGADAVAL